MDTDRLPNMHNNIHQKWLQHVRRMDTKRLPNKHNNIHQKWLQNVRRMDTNRLTKQALQYKTKEAITCTVYGHNQTNKISITI